MKLLNNTLYLEFTEAVLCGMNAKYISKAKSIGTQTIPCIDDPADKRKVLINYEDLAPRYKQMVQAKWPNPYEQLAKEPIRKMVTKDVAAETFYLNYKYNGTQSLPPDTINKLTTAASWLNMLTNAEANKKEIKQLLNLSLADFWVKVCDLIKEDKIDLPASYKRLREKMQEYNCNNYTCLIHGQFGKATNLKVTGDVAEAVMLEICEAPHVDDTARCRAYNQFAVLNSLKQIVPETVGIWRRKNAAILLNGNKGSKVWYNTFGKVIHGKRPSAPLLLVEHDDNDLDLYFKKTKKGTAQVLNFGRFVIAVVIDAYNDYVLGWAMAETYTKELIALAYLDAMYHINELTGAWYLPHQIKSDRFGVDKNLTNDLSQFYKKIATYTPAKVGAPRGKYIEQSFGKKWHALLNTYQNYADHNITSKTGINMELIQANKGIFPNESEAPLQIAHFINRVRNLQKTEGGLSRQEQWITAFKASQLSQQKQITDDMQLLHIFGTMHTFKNQIGDNMVQITNRGIDVTIGKQPLLFDIPDEIYMQVVGKRVHVIYEPYNLNRVLITDGSTTRFVATAITEDLKQPRALADFKPGDRERLNHMLNAKANHVKVFQDAKEKRKNTMQLSRIDAAGLLQSGMLVKGEKQYAELVYQNNLLSTGDAVQDAINNM